MAKRAAKSQEKPRELTPREKLFVAHYIKEPNATKAAAAAGYSPKSARQQGARLLTYPHVAQEISRALEQQTAAVLSEAEVIKHRLRNEIEADIADLFDDDDTLKPVHRWPKIWRLGLVTGIEIEEQYDQEEKTEKLEPQGHGGALKRAKRPRIAVGRISKIKLSDRIRRLELYGRHVDVQAWKDKKELSADEPLTKLFEQIAGNSIKPQSDDGAAT